MLEVMGAAPLNSNALMPAALPSATSIVLLPVPGSFEAATAITRLPAAGAPSVFSAGPELPAAATTEQPSIVALSEATAVGSSGPPPPPRLMLITFAIGFGCRSGLVGETASSIAMTMLDVRQPPTAPLTPPTVESESLHTL